MKNSTNTINIFKKAVSATSIVSLVLFSVFILAEPKISLGQATSSQTSVITLNVTAGISVTGGANSTMSQPLSASANSAVGTTTLTVITNNALGYTLALRATSSPAMASSSAPSTFNITDYQTGAPNTWNATTSNAYFGYSGFGTDVSTGTWGTGSVCNGGSNGSATSTTLRYKGFTTSDFTIATRNATTTPAGNVATICYAVEQRNFFVPATSYNATIIATGTTL